MDITSTERPWNGAPDALGKCGMQLIPFQQCCIEYSMLDENHTKYRRASKQLQDAHTPFGY